MRRWTFGQRIAAGFALIVAFALVIAAVAVVALDRVVAAKDVVIDDDAAQLVLVQQIEVALGRKVVAVRGFLLDGQSNYLDNVAANRQAFRDLVTQLDALDGVDHVAVAGIRSDEDAHQQATDAVTAMRIGGASVDDIARAFDDRMVPAQQRLEADLTALSVAEGHALAGRTAEASATAERAVWLLSLLGAMALVGAGMAAWILTRTLGRQIGTAVAQVESASTELQSAANQQAVGSREQANAMTEINTTIGELLASSRQIAESAQRVAAIAGETSGHARTGDKTVEKAQEAFGSIRRQTDLVVQHMLELGTRSQQIGSVLDIVGELSEQTNILAINATIEAAGAGESGRRFGVVAEEIRKLADRVAASTKEIRGLIDDVRGAVNTTVMATETGKKAVDAGSRSFADVAASFQQIASMVGTTKDAAREIELSTKQQSTAVEQVNVAIASAAQSTRETEVSAAQTLQTASQLATLSGGLRELVQARERE